MNYRNMRYIGLIVMTAALVGCATASAANPVAPPPQGYRQAMRDFVEGISAYARGINPKFLVIPQNGEELLTSDGSPVGAPDRAYLDALGGIGREDLFYGYTRVDTPTPAADRAEMLPFMEIARNNGLPVLVIDYCSTHSCADDSYAQSRRRGFLSFAADHRELDDIPAYPGTPENVNNADITSLAQARNFLYLINPQAYATKADFLDALRSTNYDVIVIDLFYHNAALTASDVASLKEKANGGRRLVIAYMSIGEAENYRYYWNPIWETSPPSWLAAENPKWPGNYKVRYWDRDWQSIIYGNDASYLKKILDAGFDGAYLDVVDAFQYFEARR